MPRNREPVKYAVVGLGWIAQETVLPAFQHVTNSKLVALVSGDANKTQELARRYGIPRTCSYDGYERLLNDGGIDAVYLASPNSVHRQQTEMAANAGIHVLCEKPMAATSEDCEAMISAARSGRIKLMIAYRLHFEPANLKAIGIITSGQLGELRVFSSTFCQQVEKGNIRLRKDLAGGPLMDMGVYPINAARYAFRAEPVQAIAFGANNGDERFREVHEAASVILRFPSERLASFTCSFGAAPADQWQAVGTKGWLQLAPAFDYHKELTLTTTIDGQEHRETVPKHDQFGAEISYFSDCILEDREPEPSGREGLADLRIVEAALASMRTGRSVAITPSEVTARPDESMKIELPPVEPAAIIGASSPGGAR
jgi:predicted dehydrogenase